MKRLRLLALIEAADITGPAKNLLQFAAAADALGVETTIATFVRAADINLFVETGRRQGLVVRTVREAHALDLSVLPQLRRLIHELKPDILQTHAVKSHFLARMAGLTRMAPWVAFHHGYTWTTWKTRAYNELDRWSLRTARKVLTVSLPFKEELAAKGVSSERIAVIHNAIDPNWGRAERESTRALHTRDTWGIPLDRKVVLTVGRLSREKDHLMLVNAVSRIRDRVPLHLVIVGDGPERESIERRVQELGMKQQVTLTGQQPSAEPFFGIADVAVLSSRTEGSPNALLEAMASGVPAVATAVGGVPEMVENGVDALLVPPGDSGRLEAALVEVLLNGTERGSAIGQNARCKIQEKFRPERRAQILVGYYRRMVD